MKKFLCYDTNDAASGKINVSTNGVLRPKSTVPSTNGSLYQQLVTDGVGNTKWEDRLAYEDNSKLVIDAGEGVQLVKVADEIPSWASVNVPIKVWTSSGISGTTTPEEDYTDLGNGSFKVASIVAIIATDNLEVSGIVFPEKGVYFVSVSDKFYVTGIASADTDTPEITWDGSLGEIKKLDEKFLPEISAEKLPDIPAEKLPDIPAEKLPDIPVEKLPDIPAHVIEVNGNFIDSIENSSSPSYTVNNLRYSEILSIFNSKNFVIKDNAAYYRPIIFSISTAGDLFVQILVNRINTSSGNMVVAALCCNNGQNNFYRNNYWTIAGTKH